MKLLAWIGAVAIVMAASFGAGYTYAQQRADTRAWRATTTALQLQDSVRILRDSVRVDSVRVDRVVTRWRTVRDSLVDTLLVTDTLREVVRVADAAVDACLQAHGLCTEALRVAERKARADSTALVAAQRSVTITTDALQRARSKSWQHRLEGVVACGAAVYGISHLRKE